MNGPNNSIGWCDYTWTPVTGCQRNCWYCYVKRLRGYNMQPHFHPERLSEPIKLKKPARIFVCSTADLFGEWVIEDWIKQVLWTIHQCPQHTFQLLTKCPERIVHFTDALRKPNIWVGVTVEQAQYLSRLKAFLFIAKQYSLKRLFVSFEPLLSRMNIEPEELKGLRWIIIGAYTGKDADLLRPKLEWIRDIIAKAAKLKVPVFLKDNLRPVWKEELRQEFSEKLK
ncbi:MAG: DUF5131 family protein [Candidatus Omnitrophica bacterium]|nr:DUF5131 family protein [Candidatus Omnitrophota bacterium]MDD5592668.1 DUF5131 family protein [Candidatus Omnitrophota bacterium]